jgi:hypothetical protein
MAGAYSDDSDLQQMGQRNMLLRSSLHQAAVWEPIEAVVLVRFNVRRAMNVRRDCFKWVETRHVCAKARRACER